LLMGDKYRAVVRHPHLVQFDRNLARSHDDLSRNNYCIPVDPMAKTQHAVWWIVVVVVIVILLLIAVGLIWHRGISANTYSVQYQPQYPSQ
jgi:hypothetical protein